MNKTFVAAAGALALSFAGPASAFGLIDFTHADFSDGGPYTVNGLGVTIDPTNFTFNSPGPTADEDDEGFCVSNSGDLACAGDGLGITDDEVSNPGSSQVLTVTFDRAVVVHAFTFLDAFRFDDDLFEIADIAFLDDPTLLSFDAVETDHDNAGWLTGGNFGPITTTGFKLTVSGNNDRLGVTDLALASVTVSAVPLPASVLLLGAVLAGFGIAGRRRMA